MTKQIKLMVAALALAVGMFIAGGAAQAAFVWIDIYPADYGFQLCDEPGSYESLGYVPVARDQDGGPEWTLWYFECQTGKSVTAGKADVGDMLQRAHARMPDSLRARYGDQTTGHGPPND